MDGANRLGFSSLLLISVMSLVIGSALAHTTSTSIRPPAQTTTSSHSTTGSHKPRGNITNARPSIGSHSTVQPTLTHLQQNQSSSGKKNNSCNLAVDTVKKNPDKPGQFLKCERKTWRPSASNSTRPSSNTNNSTLLVVTAEWTPYDCSKKTLEECVEEFMLEKNITKGLFNSPGDYDYESYSNSGNSVGQLPSDCRVTSPPSPGGICCSSQSARLEIDNTDTQYYLQCVPTQGTQSQFGTWVRMQCPSGMIFNYAAQLCLNAYGSPLAGQPQASNLSISVGGESYAPSLVGSQPSSAGAGSTFPLCPDGERSNILCNGQYCPPKYSCHHGVCCASATDGQGAKAGALTTGRCPGGDAPAVICNDKLHCKNGFYCHQVDVDGGNGFCCELPLPSSEGSKCENGAQPLSTVPYCSLRTPCPVGYTCTDQRVCCKNEQATVSKGIVANGMVRIEVNRCPTWTLHSNISCANGTGCPYDHACYGGQCCKSQSGAMSGNQTSSVQNLDSKADSARVHNAWIWKANATVADSTNQSAAATSSATTETDFMESCPDGGEPAEEPTFCAESFSCPSGYVCDSVLLRCCRSSATPMPGPSAYDPMEETGPETASSPVGDSEKSMKGMCPGNMSPLVRKRPCAEESCPIDYYCEPGLGMCCFGGMARPRVVDISTVASLTTPAATCPNGAPSNVSCSQDSDCPRSQFCLRRQCCQQKTCPDGRPGLLHPINCNSNSSCPTGYSCIDQVCCKISSPTCADGSAPANSVSKCTIDAQCPYDFACQNSLCCYSRHVRSEAFPPKSACSGVGQPLANATCNSTSQCPPGYACEGTSCCEMQFSCPDGSAPAVNWPHCRLSSDCPLGFDCQNSLCCPAPVAFVVEPPTVIPPYIRSLPLCPDGQPPLPTHPTCDTENLCPTTYACVDFICCRKSSLTVKTCPDGSRPLSAPSFCNGFVGCPVGYRCADSVCCRDHCPNGAPPGPPCLITVWRNGTSSGLGPSSKQLGSNTCPLNHFCDLRSGLCCPMTLTKAPGIIVNSQPKCPDGRPPDSPCQTDNECARGFICTSGYCCKSKHVTNLRYQSPCPGYVSPTIRTTTTCGTSSQCPTGYFCPYSAGVCCPQPARCPDGVQSLTTRCFYDSDCPTGFNCPPMIGFCCRGPLRNCPDNTPSLVGSCSSNGQCGPGFYCPLLVGACCNSGTQTVTTAQPVVQPVNICVGSVTMSNPCSQQVQCPPTYYCNIGVCCPQQTSTPARSCPNGLPAVGPCVNGMCGTGYVCNLANNLCCTPACANGLIPVGPCVNGQCGTGFTCNTATNMCCPSLATCANGAQAVGPCVNGACGTGYACNTTTNLCCPTCPGGAQPLGLCLPGNVCGTGFTCSNNLCCPNTGNTCPDGQESVGPCFADGTCGQNFQCINNVCCQSNAGTGTCASDGQPPVGPCDPLTFPNNGGCDNGFACDNAAGGCCPTPTPRAVRKLTCPNNQPSRGPCVNGSCRTPGYICDVASRLCCPAATATSIIVQRSTMVDGDCPSGSIFGGQCMANRSCSGDLVCLTATNVCCSATSSQTCPNRQPAFGKCSAGRCSHSGLVCVGAVNLCCPSATCANGQTAVGNCVGGVCGPGFTCETASNLCCPTVATTRMCPDQRQPIPVSCNSDNDCPSGYTCPISLGACCLTSGALSPTIRPVTTSPCVTGTISGFCVTGNCGIGYYCINFVCCPVSGAGATVAPASCPDGQAAVGVCINGQCGPGFTCTANNLCCPSSTSSTAVCPDNTQPAGACIGGLCGTGFTCIVGSNICCPGAAGTTTRCLDGSTPAGPCVNNLCGVGFTCTTGNLCCPQATIAAAVCPNGQPSAGPCVQNLCAAPFTCTPENECCLGGGLAGACPNGAVGEPCNADGVSCPTAGFTCIDGATCCNLGGFAIAGGVGTGDCPAVALGPCVNGLCPTGFTCNPNNNCCVPGRTRGEPDASSEFDMDLPAPRRPYIQDLWGGGRGILGHSYGDILGAPEPILCPGGRPAAAACRYGLCQSGYTCVLEKNLCCPTGASATEFEGRSQGIPPGQTCSGARSSECSGARLGLAACVSNDSGRKACTCLPPARSTGTTCVMPPRTSISRPAVGRPYHAHSHIFPGVLSDAGPAGNETGNDTVLTPLLPIASSPTPVHGIGTPIPTFSMKTLSRTVGCGKTADCDAKLHEQCINGTCIAPKAPGEVCSSKTECIAYCPNTDCASDGRGARHCVCPEKTYRYGRKCFSKCPKGSRLLIERMECEDVAMSNMLRDSVLTFDTDVKVTSLC